MSRQKGIRKVQSETICRGNKEPKSQKQCSVHFWHWHCAFIRALQQQDRVGGDETEELQCLLKFSA